MTSLPNGCRVSAFSVFPDNWDKMKEKEFKENVSWYITYRFYDSTGKVKQLHKRRMNSFKTLASRREATKEAIDYLLDELKGGYNPITEQTIEPANTDYEIDPKTPLIKALRKALTKVKAEDKTKQDIKNVLTYVEKSAQAVRIENLAVGEVKRRHIKTILDHCAATHERWSANQFNHYRKYLNILFNQLLEYDSIEHNPIKSIKKQKTVKKIKETLSDEQRKKIDKHLRETNYTFWRYLHIFFHSGARTSELFRLQAKDVDLNNQKYKITIKKGSEQREVWKTIKDVVLPLWSELMTGISKDHYLFAYRLKPALKPIKAYQISKRWTRLIKDSKDADGKLLFPDVKATFYSLKHLSTTELVSLLSEEDAAGMNSHKGTGLVRTIYDTKNQDRQHERLKKVNNKFA